MANIGSFSRLHNTTYWADLYASLTSFCKENLHQIPYKSDRYYTRWWFVAQNVPDHLNRCVLLRKRLNICNFQCAVAYSIIIIIIIIIIYSLVVRK